MSRHDEIKNAYKYLGGEAASYDGMITCSTLPGKAVCRLAWGMGKAETAAPTGLLTSSTPQGVLYPAR